MQTEVQTGLLLAQLGCMRDLAGVLQATAARISLLSLAACVAANLPTAATPASILDPQPGADSMQLATAMQVMRAASKSVCVAHAYFPFLGQQPASLSLLHSTGSSCMTAADRWADC